MISDSGYVKRLCTQPEPIKVKDCFNSLWKCMMYASMMVYLIRIKIIQKNGKYLYICCSVSSVTKCTKWVGTIARIEVTTRSNGVLGTVRWFTGTFRESIFGVVIVPERYIYRYNMKVLLNGFVSIILLLLSYYSAASIVICQVSDK